MIAHRLLVVAHIRQAEKRGATVSGGSNNAGRLINLLLATRRTDEVEVHVIKGVVAKHVAFANLSLGNLRVLDDVVAGDEESRLDLILSQQL